VTSNKNEYSAFIIPHYETPQENIVKLMKLRRLVVTISFLSKTNSLFITGVNWLYFSSTNFLVLSL
jgi:hypothetical protein